MEERRREYPSILENLNEIKDDVKHIKRVLNGNGHMGIVAKMEVLWASSIFIIITIIGILVKIFVS